MRWGALRKIKVKLRVTLAPLGNEWFGEFRKYMQVVTMTSPIFFAMFDARFDSQRKSSGATCQSKQTPSPTNAGLLMKLF